ncbi:MAG: hypothetical protein CMH64_00415 [Nanoarchaeota archaeon]|nr:hypothetical protein [Nanoarchaeota archaeon]|tara:strand:- start:783 stop:1001 length:219 start_codon:yes stop_codon:yes gene_type:complete
MVPRVISAKPLYSAYGNNRFSLENRVRTGQLEKKASKAIDSPDIEDMPLQRLRRDVFYLPGETQGTIVDYLV